MDSRKLSTTSPAKRGFRGEVSVGCPDLISRPDEDQAGRSLARTSGHTQDDGSRDKGTRTATRRPGSAPRFCSVSAGARLR
jgi:hypothetical protein